MTLSDLSKPNISMAELAQISRANSEIWPDDLVEDMEDSDPHIYQEMQRQKELLAEKRQEIESQKQITFIQGDLFEEDTERVPPKKKIKPLPPKPVAPVFAKDTLVVPGWSKISKKHQKNWADFENLIALYALGKLFNAQNMPEKAKQDKTELTYVVEAFDRIRRPQARKNLTAEKRLASTKTYIYFGKRTIDASCEPDQYLRAAMLNDMENEYIEAIEGNEFNGWKLKKAYHIARRVIKNLRQRY